MKTHKKISSNLFLISFSFARRPIRSKNRNSGLSVKSSVSAMSSEDGDNSSEYPDSSHRSTLDSNQVIN